jgi:Ala-tRNA(Pro) deacylase
MPILKRLKDLFEDAKISYEIYNHAMAYTAQEIAEKQHFSGDEMAKVVMLVVEGNLVMAVITASQKVHLPTVGKNLGAKDVRLASEDEFTSRFPGREL